MGYSLQLRYARTPLCRRIRLGVRFSHRHELLEVKEGCPGVHYVTTTYANPIPVDSTLLVSFRVEAASATVFNFKLEADNTCDKRRASVRAILQRAGDDLYGADYRFWSNPAAIVLAEGEYTMTVKLSPDQWTNVNGKRSAVGFVETLKKIENIGLTFGGGAFLATASTCPVAPPALS